MMNKKQRVDNGAPNNAAAEAAAEEAAKEAELVRAEHPASGSSGEGRSRRERKDVDYVSTRVNTEISDEIQRPQWLKRDTKSKQPSPPAEAEAEADARPHPQPGVCLTYTAPDGTRFRKSKQPSPPADTEDDTDERLWAGASAAGWSVKPRTNNGHYTYTAPDGRRFHNKREALEAAAETAPSSGAGAGTAVGGPSGGSGARAVDGAEATAPGRAGTGAGIDVGSRVVNKAGTRGEIVARSGAWLTMRTEAGEERRVLNRAELTLLSAGVAGEAGEAGSGDPWPRP